MAAGADWAAICERSAAEGQPHQGQNSATFQPKLEGVLEGRCLRVHG